MSPVAHLRRLLAVLCAAAAALLLAGAPVAAAAGPVATAATAVATTGLEDGAVPAGPVATATSATDLPADQLVIFWGDGCPNCAAQNVWLGDYATDHPDLDVAKYEVWNDAANRDLFAATGEELGFQASAVPTTVLGERVWIGWNAAVQADMEGALATVMAGGTAHPGVFGTEGAGTCTGEDGMCSGEGGGSTISLPWIGEVALAEQSLLVSTVIIGFVDGVNPCSLWVISVLLTIVLRTKDRRRVIAIGSTFLLVTAAMYALYMAAFYSALTLIGAIGWIQAGIAVAAAVVGAVSVKDYFAFKKGLSFTIADSSKPGIYKRVREAAAQKSIVAAIGATIILAVAVSLLEAPCTAGFPMMWTGLLHANGVGPAETAGLFVAYMVPYLIDEFVVFGIALVTMRATKLQDRHGELLKLFAGVTMLALAGVMVIDPTVMEQPLLALALFMAAFGLAFLIHVVTTQVRRLRAARAELEELAAQDLPEDDAVGTGR
ncbi:hypothetical protein [Demequina pelophila]|uniref:hypothetical protein n=1 Tax=Demequina pelophila TaxID=1638984 RepID=UPI000783CC4A|nr:hypothetical protein [Demequina pelophila]